MWRHAMFLGTVFESTRTRVIGVDGKAGPILLSAIDTLCTDGWLSGTACGNVALAYEETNMGQGWFQFHHHHSHISLKHLALLPDNIWCAHGSCAGSTIKSIARRPAGIHRIR